MNFRVITAVVLIAAASGLGWLAVKALNPVSTPAVAAQVTSVRVLVAAQALRTGVLLKDSDVRLRDMPVQDVPDGAIMASEDSMAEVQGAMLRRFLDAGMPLIRGDILRPRDRGFLAAVLSPGARAVSIGVDARTGASGLISPGDLVDVILTQEFQRGDTPAGRRVVAETVLTGIRVIAVDQQFAQGGETPPTGAASAAGRPRVASTVTLQVTSEQSERVAVAERLGRLLLTVRSMDAEEGAPRPATVAEADPAPAGAVPAARPGGVVFGSDVSSALLRDEPSAMPRMRVIQGANRNDVIFR